MNNLLEDIKKYKDYITYTKGYRLVYYYSNHHEVPRGLYKENYNDFVENKNITIEEYLKEILDTKKEILGVAIYDINGKCIIRKNRDNIKEINDSTVFKEELIYDYKELTATSGYRVVYFTDDNNYSLGLYTKNIEDLMTDFVEYEPYLDEEIPPFVSIEDILDRYLEMKKDIKAVAIYNIDGNCIARKNRYNDLKI